MEQPPVVSSYVAKCWSSVTKINSLIIYTRNNHRLREVLSIETRSDEKH